MWFGHNTVSNILKNAPAHYARSYLYTERDEGDVTYFVLYQLRVIMRAVEELNAYLRRKMTNVTETEKPFRHLPDLDIDKSSTLSRAIPPPTISP